MSKKKALSRRMSKKTSKKKAVETTYELSTEKQLMALILAELDQDEWQVFIHTLDRIAEVFGKSEHEVSHSLVRLLSLVPQGEMYREEILRSGGWAKVPTVTH